jgi:hypothetical protein
MRECAVASPTPDNSTAKRVSSNGRRHPWPAYCRAPPHGLVDVGARRFAERSYLAVKGSISIDTKATAVSVSTGRPRRNWSSKWARL